MAKTFNFKSFIISSLRRATYRWPAREEARRLAKVARNQYRCATCTNIYGRKDTKIDHIIPVVGEEGFTTWDNYIARLFCDANNFQILCRQCHNEKTKLERQTRALVRNNNTRQDK